MRQVVGIGGQSAAAFATAEVSDAFRMDGDQGGIGTDQVGIVDGIGEICAEDRDGL